MRTKSISRPNLRVLPSLRPSLFSVHLPPVGYAFELRVASLCFRRFPEGSAGKQTWKPPNPNAATTSSDCPSTNASYKNPKREAPPQNAHSTANPSRKLNLSAPQFHNPQPRRHLQRSLPKKISNLSAADRLPTAVALNPRFCDDAAPFCF